MSSSQMLLLSKSLFAHRLEDSTTGLCVCVERVREWRAAIISCGAAGRAVKGALEEENVPARARL